MTARATAALTLATALCIAGGAQAQGKMYKCVDSNGKVYYTQVPPRECLGRETEELSRQGSVTKRTEAALTPEQRAAREAERKKQLEQEALAQEEARKNRALLSTYASEKDIDEARTRAIRENDVAIKEIESQIASGEKRRQALEKEKEFYRKRQLPAKLEEDIKNNDRELGNQKTALETKKKQVAAINAKYDEDKRRYLELTRSGAGVPASKK